MPLPIPPNTTCDIYRDGNSPPAAPDVAGVPCYLVADYGRHTESGEGDPMEFRFTHTMLVTLDTDIRDGYTIGAQTGTQNSVWIPDQNGTQFYVRFVEVKARGTPGAHKKVYLDRLLPTWPTDNI